MGIATLPAGALTGETLELMKGSQKGFGTPQGLYKSGYNLAENLVGINLEAPSKKLFPVYSPLRNRFARISSPVGATAVQWRAIRTINSANLWPGVPENTRNAFNTTLTESKSATFKTIGHDDYVGFEALAASKSFEDIRATAALNLLYSVMVSEEKVLLGGNMTNIGVVTTLAGVSAATPGGTLVAATTHRITVSALVLRGFDKAEKAAAAAGPNEADGETIGAFVDVLIGAGHNSVVTTWDEKRKAVAYNVFSGVSPASLYLTTVTVNTFTVLADGVGANANTTDLTGSANEFDGVISQIEGDVAAAQYVSRDGGTLTSDAAGGITEFDSILKGLWDTFKLGPTCILVNSEQARDITKKIGGSSSLSYRIYLEDGQRNVVGGIYVGAYLNKFASSFAEGIPNEIPIKIHPNLPAGTILFVTEALPYPNNQVPNVWEVEVRQEYTQYEFALTQRRYEFGIYSQEVLKGYFNVAQAALVCVGPG